MKKSQADKIKHLKIGTRGSPLALFQAEQVKAALVKRGVSSEICVVQTEADLRLDIPIVDFGGKGVFAKEIEQALLAGKVDIGVHSLKDMSVALQPVFCLAAVLPRDYPLDILVVHKRSRLWNLDKAQIGAADLAPFDGLKIASSSLRRQGLLKEACRNIELSDIRGNIATRLSKLEASSWDGIVLAEASLRRLGLGAEFRLYTFDPMWFIPCAGQGVVGVECLQEGPLAEFLRDNLQDAKTRRCVDVERQILKDLGGDCRLPIGAYCQLGGTELAVKAVILDMDGNSIRVEARSADGAKLCEEVSRLWSKDSRTEPTLKKLGLK